MSRIYSNPVEAVREIERDIWEMGVDVHPQTMQDKKVADNEDFKTKEVQGYSFKIHNCPWTCVNEEKVLDYFFKGAQRDNVLKYIAIEHSDRISGSALNPGNSHLARVEVWNEFLHNGKFHYTYSERMCSQIALVARELKERPDTRQAIINIHSNICPDRPEMGAFLSRDAFNTGGTGRIPCSMYYQFMRRSGRLDIIYTMRSCDFLTHFPVDIMLAQRLQKHFADYLQIPSGTFTYFAGSLHAYNKDIKLRGVF